MEYCSDMMNLRALYGGDRSAEPRARLTKARAALADAEAKLERLMDVILATGSDVPSSFAAKARQLEAERDAAQKGIEEAERDLAHAARVNLKGVDEIWRTLAAGVEAQDYDARMKARKLVGDTFERIVVFWKGMKPRKSVGVGQRNNLPIDLVLVAKGGVSRLIHIDAKGEWLAGDEVRAA